jgi:uncharacterized protein (DUF1330 family)
MKTHYALVAGVGAFIAGGVAVQTLHAQAKPPVYFFAEIDVSNPEGYGKEYAPKAQAIIKSAGGQVIAAAGAAATGPKVTALAGDPPKRIVLQRWESLEKLQAWYNSSEHQEVRKVGEQYAKFRSFAFEGLSQQ